MRPRARPDFDAFVAVRGPALLRLAYLLTGHQHDAEDLLQAALARLFVKWPYVLRADNPDSYARALLINLHVGHRRLRRLLEIPAAQLPDRALQANDEAGVLVERDEVAAALRRLAPRQRAVLLLRFYEDVSVEETARVLNCSTGTVKSQTSDALRRLRSLLPDPSGVRGTRT